MATNSRLRLLLTAAVLLLLLAPSLGAQSAGYYIEMEGSEPRFFQRLAWTGGEYALRYEVVIETEDGETYLQEFTETLFIEVSLPPGRYRYQVRAYNILGRPEGVSPWEYIEVLPAVQPEIFDIRPEFVSGGGEFSGYVLVVSGHNIVPGVEFIIRHSDGSQIVPEALDFDEGGNARIFIDSDTPALGEYEIIVINPGGLEARMSGIAFPPPESLLAHTPETGTGIKPEPKKPILLIAGIAWAPVFPNHGIFFGEKFTPAGAAAHFGAVFPTPDSLYLGAELSVYFHANNGGADDDVSDGVLSVGANILTMKWLPNQTMAIAFRLGASYILVPDMQEKMMFNLGVSYLWRFTDRFILEAGFDYAVLLKGSYINGGIRPWIGAGVIF